MISLTKKDQIKVLDNPYNLVLSIVKKTETKFNLRHGRDINFLIYDDFLKLANLISFYKETENQPSSFKKFTPYDLGHVFLTQYLLNNKEIVFPSLNEEDRKNTLHGLLGKLHSQKQEDRSSCALLLKKQIDKGNKDNIDKDLVKFRSFLDSLAIEFCHKYNHNTLFISHLGDTFVNTLLEMKTNLHGIDLKKGSPTRFQSFTRTLEEIIDYLAKPLPNISMPDPEIHS